MVIVYRQCKGGSFRFASGVGAGQFVSGPYMGREQAERAAVKRLSCNPWEIVHVPNPESRHHMISPAEAMQAAASLSFARQACGE